MKKVLGILALLAALAACNKNETDLRTANQTAEATGNITITATLSPKTGGTKAVAESGGNIVVDWATTEHIAILYEVSSVKKVADAEITAVDGEGKATITFTVDGSTPDNTPCTIVYPLAAAKDDHSGVKDAATLLATQDGTLSPALDVRVGAGKILVSTPELDVTTQPAAQFAIFKFTLGSAIDNTHPLYIKDNTDAVITTVTPTTSTTTAYVAMEPAATKYFKFTATTAASKIISKSSTATIAAGNFYQTTLAVPTLGDLYYSDGTYSTTLQAGKTAIGVIAYLGTDNFTENGTIVGGSAFTGHGLVLCLKNAASEVCWSNVNYTWEFTGQEVDDTDDLKRTTNVSGYTNTTTLAAKADAQANYPAAYQAKNYTGLTAPATGTTGWFLPSAQQWVKMIEGLGELADGAPNFNDSWFDNSHGAVNKWEAAFGKAGTAYDSMTGYLWYWSSSESHPTEAVCLYIDATHTGTDYGFKWGRDPKLSAYTNYRVRPVLAF